MLWYGKRTGQERDGKRAGGMQNPYTPPTITPVPDWKNRIRGHGAEPPESLLANPRNWRRHPAFQEDALRAAMDRVGWVQDVIVNQQTGHVVDGHLRIAAAISTGQPAVPVVYVDLSPDEERLVLATFDPLGALARADDALLQELLRDVRPHVDDPNLTKLLADLSNGLLYDLGADPATLGDLIETEKAPDPTLSEGQATRLDEVGQQIERQEPDALRRLRERWATAPGQTWSIPSGTTPGARHALVVGDCCAPPLIARLEPALVPGAVIVTSPPYGMGQDYEDAYRGQQPYTKRGEKDHRGPDQTGGNPTREGVTRWVALIQDFVNHWQPVVHGAAINLADHTVAPTPGYGRHTYGDLVDACTAAGWETVATRIWKKPPMLGNNPYWLNSYKAIPETEFVGFFSTPGRFPFRPVAERVPRTEDWRFRTVWEFGTVASQQLAKGFHPAAFPAELPRRCVLLFTDPGGTVVDPFLGSGTTLVAAEALGRVCLGVERDPLYAAMALERCTRLGLSPEKKEG